MPSRFWKASGNALLPGSNFFSTAGGLGPELTTNGDFSTSTSWSLGSGASITGGHLVLSATNGYGLFQSASIVSGHVYRCVFDIVAYTSGSATPYVGSNGTLSGTPGSAVGTFTQDITADSSSELGFGFGVGFTGTIDNFSVKEVL